MMHGGQREWRCDMVRFQAENAVADQPVRRLLLIKRAISEVTSAMQADMKVDVAKHADDKLGWAIRFLRAAEHSRVGAMIKCSQAYPRLAVLVKCPDPNLRLQGGLAPLRAHALGLARGAITKEI